ncbi:hypothetical protein BD413DRAFT_493672 [Trametes elegans]|nr:hypothetical protein BD413DRAFT_493672 [Trametes elegans]
MFSTKFVAVLTALLVASSSATASSDVKPSGTSDSPAIWQPSGDEVWTVGATETVRWSPSDLPSAEDGGRLLLGSARDETGDYHHISASPLATNVSLASGALDVVVPNVPPGDAYVLTLYIGKDSINPSAPFTIVQ